MLCAGSSLHVGGTLRQVLGDLEGHLQTLLVVQARIHERLVTVAQRLVINVLAAANHLGDVITGEFDVQAARDSSRGLVGLEEATELISDRRDASCSRSTT